MEGTGAKCLAVFIHEVGFFFFFFLIQFCRLCTLNALLPRVCVYVTLSLGTYRDRPSSQVELDLPQRSSLQTKLTHKPCTITIRSPSKLPPRSTTHLITRRVCTSVGLDTSDTYTTMYFF